MIPFSPPDIRDEDVQAVVDVLRSGWITTGPRGMDFRDALSEYSGTPDTILMSSATTAMEAVLRALGVGPGDEVVTTAYTYSASAAVIEHVGAEIVLIDTEPGEFVPSIERYIDAITPRTKAVIPVDLGGVAYPHPDLRDALASCSDSFTSNSDWQEALGRVAVIADAAHSLGSQLDGLRSGALADFTAFSFHAVKNLTTAEGGAVTWRSGLPINDGDIARRLTLLSLHGQTKDALAKAQAGAWEYDIEVLGYKSNMPDILAALGLSQLGRYEEMIARRLEIARAYDAVLADCGAWSLRHEGDGFRSSGHLFLAQLRGDDHEAVRERRNSIIRYMAEAGVSTNVHYKPLPLLTAYRNMGFTVEDYPNAYAQYCRVLSLPLHTLLTDEDVAVVTRTFREAIGEQNNW